MKVNIIEIIEGSKKRMGKFSVSWKEGELIKFKSSLGEGHAHFLSKKNKEILKNIDIDVETMYDKIEKFGIIEYEKDYLGETNQNCSYHIIGKVEFIYRNFEKKELVRISCGGWEFFIGENEINLSKIEAGMGVEFIIHGLELYDNEIG